MRDRDRVTTGCLRVMRESDLLLARIDADFSAYEEIGSTALLFSFCAKVVALPFIVGEHVAARLTPRTGPSPRCRRSRARAARRA